MTQDHTLQLDDSVAVSSVTKERQFKGLSLAERKSMRREKLIEAGMEVYGKQGFFSTKPS